MPFVKACDTKPFLDSFFFFFYKMSPILFKCSELWDKIHIHRYNKKNYKYFIVKLKTIKHICNQSK